MKKLSIGNGVATNSFLLVFVHVITTLIGIVVTKLLSVHFSLEEYGTYSQAILVTNTITSVSILGLTNGTNYYYNKTNDENTQRVYVSTIFCIQYFMGIFSMLAVILLRNSIATYFNNDKLSKILLIVAPTPLFTNLISMYQTLFVSIGEAKKIAARNVVVSIARLIAVFAACFIFENIVFVLFVVLILDIGQVMYFRILFEKDKFNIRIKFVNIGIVREILAYSIPMAIYVMSNSLNRDIDKYVISYFSNTESLAIYTNAAKLLPFDMITSALITVLIPIITRMINQGRFGEAKKVFSLYLRMGFLMTCIFVGGAISLSKQLMLFLYDYKYISGLRIFIIYLFIDMIRFANVTTILSGAGKSRILMRISLITLCLNAVLNILGFKCFGMIGPAIVTLLLTIIMTYMLLFYGSKEIHTRIYELFDFKEIGIVFSEIIVSGFAFYFISSFLEDIHVPNIACLVICYGLYLFTLFGLNYKRILGCYKALNMYK